VGTISGMSPLHVVSGRCAAVERRNEVAQWGSNCVRPVAVRARWRFADGIVSLLLCEVHARELDHDERLSYVVWFYDATVERHRAVVE
jgi:hypothetical protein